MQVKIGDFGLACIENLNSENGYLKSSSASSLSSTTTPTPTSPVSFFLQNEDNLNLSLAKEKETNNEHTKGVGTSLYASPEQLKGKVYDTKVGVFFLNWSFEISQYINFSRVTCLV